MIGSRGALGLLLGLALCACGASQTPAGPPPLTVGRRALLDKKPVLVAQAVPGTRKVVLQLDEADGTSRPTRLADLDSFNLKTIWPRPLSLAGTSGTKATLVGSTEMLQLDVETGAVQPVSPPPFVAPLHLSPGIAAGDFYLYLTAEGRIAALPPGGAQATLLAASDCPTTGLAYVDLTSTRFPGWMSIFSLETCPTSPVEVGWERLVNPALGLASGRGLRFYDGAHSLFFVSNAGGFFQLLAIDPATGNATPIAAGDGAGIGRPGLDSRYRSADGRLAYEGTFDALIEIDLAKDTVRRMPAPLEAEAVFFPGSTTGAAGIVVDTAVVRLDLGKSVPFCEGSRTGARLARPTFLVDAPFGAFCQDGATLLVYDWASDTVTTLTTANTSLSLEPRTNDVVWTEAGGSRMARIGGNSPAVAPCPAGFSGPRFSEDGSTALLTCDGASDPIVVDLATGVTKTALVTPPGASVTIQGFALSPHGRFAIVSYSTTAPPTDAISCPAARCTWAFDRITGQGVRTPVDEALAGTFNWSVTGTPADDAIAMPGENQYRSTILVAASAGVPQAIVVAGQFDHPMALVNGALAVTGTTSSVRVDFASGKVTPEPAIDPRNRIGLSNDYLIAGDVIFHMEADSSEPLSGIPFKLCGGTPGTPGLAWYETAGRAGLGPFPLRRYAPGIGFETISANAVPFAEIGCESQRVFLDAAAYEGTSRLVRFDVGTGAIHDLVPNVAAGVLWQDFGHEFVFQNPAGPALDSMGDLVLFDEGPQTVRPLGARAATHSARVSWRGSIVVAGGTPGKLEVIAAHLDGSGIEKLGPGGQTIFTSPDRDRVLWRNGSDLMMQTAQGPVTIDHFGATYLASDHDASHILYSMPPTAGSFAGTWAFALQ